MALAECLPVVGVPELLVVTLMSFDVIDDRGGRHPAFARTENTERMLREVGCPSLLPRGRVAALARRAAVSFVMPALLGRLSMASGVVERWSERHPVNRIVDH